MDEKVINRTRKQKIKSERQNWLKSKKKKNKPKCLYLSLNWALSQNEVCEMRAPLMRQTPYRHLKCRQFHHQLSPLFHNLVTKQQQQEKKQLNIY